MKSRTASPDDKSLLPAFSSSTDEDVSFDGEAVEYHEQSFTRYLGFVVLSGVVSSFQFGYNLGVVNTPETAIRECPLEGPGDSWLPTCIAMDTVEWGTVVAVFSLGGLVGGLSGGHICKLYGRQKTLLYNNSLFLLGGVLVAAAPNIAMFAIGRFLLGVGSGISTAAVPLYMGELPPTRHRGTVGALHQLAIVVGILVSAVLGLFMSNYPGWRWMLGMTVVPALLQTLALPFCTETPRFLVSKGKIEQARMALQRLRGTLDVEDELNCILSSHERDAVMQDRPMTIPELLKKRQLRKPLVLAVAAQLAQQFSGINGVMQFSTSIFTAILGDMASILTVSVSVINLLMTLVAVYLMDRAGRRALLLTSQFGMALISALIVVSSLYDLSIVTAVGVIAFVATFAIGLGPVPWLIMPEIMPTYAVSSAASISVTVNWLSSTVTTLIFPVILNVLGDWTFLPFAVITFLLGVVMLVMLPETKGRTIDEIARLLQ